MEMPQSRTVWARILTFHEDPARVQELVVTRYQEPLLRFATRQGLSEEDAEDIVQELFVRICRTEFLQKADRNRGRFRNYLLKAMKNEIASFREYELAGKRDRRRVVPLPEDDRLPDGPADPEFDWDWVMNLVKQALDSLGDDPKSRGDDRPIRALRLYVTTEKGYREIGEALEESESNVNNWINRWKKRILPEIEKLAEEYSASEDHQEEIQWVRQKLERNRRLSE